MYKTTNRNEMDNRNKKDVTRNVTMCTYPILCIHEAIAWLRAILSHSHRRERRKREKKLVLKFKR